MIVPAVAVCLIWLLSRPSSVAVSHRSLTPGDVLHGDDVLAIRAARRAPRARTSAWRVAFAARAMLRSISRVRLLISPAVKGLVPAA